MSQIPLNGPDNAFPSAANVSVFIDGVYIDLAFRLDFKSSIPKVPIYGYNDTVYTKTIPGRKIVQGFLVVNFIIPGYLTMVIKEIQDRRQAGQERTRGYYRPDFSLLPGEESSRKARAEILAGLLFSYWVPHSDETISVLDLFDRLALKRTIMSQFLDGPGVEVNPALVPPSDILQPFNMNIYYSDPAEANWYVHLKDVEITDISQSHNMAGAEGSAEPLYETYEFIAKDRKVIKT